jgi:DNA-binding response OmpR family regulator
MGKAQTRILIANNRRDMRTLLELALSDAGFQVFSAPSGKSALLQMDVVSPQLIILDGQMPGMDGWETLRRIRAQSAVPVIVLLGLDGDNQPACLAAGADACLVEPFNIQELFARVYTLLSPEQGPAEHTAVA